MKAIRNVLIFLLATATLAACYDVVFPDLDALGGGSSPTSPYEATLELSSTDPHPGDVITFTFTVTEDGAPLEGIAPNAMYMQTSGGDAMGDIPLVADSAPGVWTGQTALPAGGTYSIELTYEDPVDSTEIVERFTVTLDSH